MIVFYRIFLGAALVLLLGGGPAVASSQTETLDSLLDRIAERLESYPDLESWAARVNSTTQRMDKNWRPKKITVVDKNITVRDGEWNEEILKATEEKKGKIKDITKKMAADAAIERAKARQKRKKEKEKKDERGDRGREFVVSLDEILPFGVKQRPEYEITRLDDDLVGSVPVHVLSVKAREPSDKRFDGEYFIDRTSFDIIKADLRPSKKRSVLKRFKMEIYLQVLPEGYLVLKETHIQLHVGLIIKNIRIDARETYSDYRIIN